MRHREVAVDGVRFAIDRGDPSRKRRTTPALLLHGVPETRAMWGPLAAELVRDRVVIAPDLKGLGDSEARGPYDVPTLVRELAALALHEVDGQVDVVGHDWGGSLALAMALTRPDLVRRLVVINAPYRHIDFRHAWHIPFFALPLVPEALFAVGGRSLVGRMLDYGWRAETALDPALREQYATAYADRARVAAMLGYYRASVRTQVRRAGKHAVRRLRREGVVAANTHTSGGPRPSLVIWGAADPVLPLPVGESVVRDLGPSARLVTLPGVGHFTVDEAPDRVVDLVATFLREQAGERAPA
jgi:haloacetate dehalogenase